MTITLTADEVARAVEKYVRGKNTSDSPHHDYAVRMVWRGEHAVVTITRKRPEERSVIEILEELRRDHLAYTGDAQIPTLTDKVREVIRTPGLPDDIRITDKVRDAKSWGY